MWQETIVMDRVQMERLRCALEAADLDCWVTEAGDGPRELSVRLVVHEHDLSASIRLLAPSARPKEWWPIRPLIVEDKDEDDIYVLYELPLSQAVVDSLILRLEFAALVGDL